MTITEMREKRNKLVGMMDTFCEALISTPTLKSGNRPYSMNIK